MSESNNLLSYVCSECGGFAYVDCDSIDSGTTFTCDSCHGATVVSLDKPGAYKEHFELEAERDRLKAEVAEAKQCCDIECHIDGVQCFTATYVTRAIDRYKEKAELWNLLQICKSIRFDTDMAPVARVITHSDRVCFGHTLKEALQEANNPVVKAAKEGKG